MILLASSKSAIQLAAKLCLQNNLYINGFSAKHYLEHPAIWIKKIALSTYHGKPVAWAAIIKIPNQNQKLLMAFTHHKHRRHQHASNCIRTLKCSRKLRVNNHNIIAKNFWASLGFNKT